MLVLTRKAGERIIVGQDVEVRVLEVRGTRVRLGISGPAEIPIHRHEVHEKLHRPASVRTDARVQTQRGPILITTEGHHD